MDWVRLGVSASHRALVTFEHLQLWAFPLLKTTSSDVQSLLLWRIAFLHLWSEFSLLQLVTIDSCPFTVYIWEESISIFSMSSFSVVKDAIKAPLDHLFSGQHKPSSLSFFFYLIHPSCMTILVIHCYSWFVALSHVGGPSSRFSMVCWIENVGEWS